MSLHFILGGSGSGKSAFIYQHIIRQSLDNPEKKYLVIVPEQSTLQTTREIILHHPAKGILNIDVLSFHRLSARVFEEAGAGGEKVLSETGKNLVIRRAASGIRDSLPWLGAKLERQGYVSQVKSILSELAQYEVTPGMLRALAEERESIAENGGRTQHLHAGTSLLDMKLSDIALLQEAFDEARRGLFITAEEVPALLARYAPQSRLLAGCTLVFDGFTGFTPVQMTAIRALLRCAAEVFVTVTVPEHEEVFGKIREHELFALSKRTIQALAKMASEEGVPVAPLQWIGPDHGRHMPGSELSRLEKGFLRPAPKREEHEAGRERQVRIVQLPDPAAEAAFAVATARSLIRDEGYDPSEIGLICSDLSEYAPHLIRAFERAHIPCFIDRKEPVLMNPCLEFIRAATEAADKNFSYVSVMRLLRTGLTDLSREETDLLETYLLASGVRSFSGWKKPWVRVVRSLTPEQLETVNSMRERFVSGMEAFMKAFSSKEETIHTYTAALTGLLESFEIEAKLQDASRRPTGLGRSQTARKDAEYDHVFESVRKVMDEADMLLGEGRVCREEYVRILEAGFEQAQIGMLPAMSDQVHVGDLLRSRPGSLKALLFLGMNEGLVPSAAGSGGLLTERDREVLGAYGIRLSPTMREDIYIQRFYLYLGLTRPSRRLYLTFSAGDSAGNPVSPSPILREVRRVLEEVKVETVREPLKLTLEDAVKDIALQVGRGELPGKGPAFEKMLNQLEKAGVSMPLTRVLAHGGISCSDEQITAGTAHVLYGEGMTGSVSRMDSFAQCPFRHFLAYGLTLREREEFTVRTLDTGTLFHDALERFGRYMNTDHAYDWRTVSDEQASRLVYRCVEESGLELFQGLFSDTERNRFAKERVAKILSDSVWVMLRQVRAGDQTPYFFETGFADKGVKGRIDRIDICERGDQVYAAVVDYKSGKQKFDLRLIRDGRTLQLPVYLGNALRFLRKRYPGKEIIPAGMLYYHLKEPVYQAKAGSFPSSEQITEGLLEALRPSGIVNLEPDALNTFAEDEQIRNLIIPGPKYNRDGSLSARSPLAATGRQLGSIVSFTERKMEEMRESILGGTIKAEPYRDQKGTVCAWCPYRSACSFDLRLPGASCRYKTGDDPAEILRNMSREEEKQNSQPQEE